jgi:hypothetical protein
LFVQKQQKLPRKKEPDSGPEPYENACVLNIGINHSKSSRSLSIAKPLPLLLLLLLPLLLLLQLQLQLHFWLSFPKGICFCLSSP